MNQPNEESDALAAAEFNARFAQAEMELERYRNVMRSMLKEKHNRNPGFQEQLTNVSIRFSQLRTLVAALKEQKLLLQEGNTNEQ